MPAVQAKARECGAHGFVDKQVSTEVLSQALFAVLGGMTWFGSQHAPTAGAVRSHDIPVTAAELGLSLRQGQILALVLQGLPNKRIAQAFDLSESTVKEHVSGILQKMAVTNRVEAITKMRGKRLVE